MPPAKRTVTVRMYNVGFGDAFVVTVRKGKQRWKLLVDCGVHSHGRARDLEEAVQAIIADLAADSADGIPYVDVIAATHHHADHIAGFQYDSWQEVAVGEVWVPFVEDPDDDDAKALRTAQIDTAHRLLGLLERRTVGFDPGAWPDALTTARWFAANSSGNEIATDRLLGRRGRTFAKTPKVRYFPTADPNGNTLAVGVPGTTVHMLGPSRDPSFLKRMDPPARAGWLTLDDGDLAESDRAPLFDPARYVLGPDELDTIQHLTEGHQALRNLDRLADDAILAAASVLERSVNNTSLFFVLKVGDLRLLFPGDAQQGAWDFVFTDPDKVALVSNVAFYKISHHGSHNGTPKRYVEDFFGDGAAAMLPWGLVKRWADTIPKTELLDALEAHHHHITRADKPVPEPGRVTVKDDLWSEITFTAP